MDNQDKQIVHAFVEVYHIEGAKVEPLSPNLASELYKKFIKQRLANNASPNTSPKNSGFKP